MMTIKGGICGNHKGWTNRSPSKSGKSNGRRLAKCVERGDDDAGRKFLHLLVFWALLFVWLFWLPFFAALLHVCGQSMRRFSRSSNPRNSRNFLICFVEQKIICFAFESFHSQFALDLLLLLSSQKTLAHSTYRSWLFLVKLLCTLRAAAAAAYILEQLFCILHLWTLSVWTKGRNQIHHYREFQDCQIQHQIQHQSFQSHHQRVFKIARFNIWFGTRLIDRESLFKITIIDNSFITR